LQYLKAGEAEKEEQFVAPVVELRQNHGAADRRRVVVVLSGLMTALLAQGFRKRVVPRSRCLGNSRIPRLPGEEIKRVPSRILVGFLEVAVKLVGPCLGHQRNVRPAGMPIRGIEARGFDFHRLHEFGSGHETGPARGAVIRNTVH
jgi:hypothetical protein